MSEAAAPLTDAASDPTRISISDGFGRWLRDLDFSFAFSSYQSGQLLMVGLRPDGTVAVSQQQFEHAMGLAWHDGRLFLAAQTQIWRFENLLLPGELGDGTYDRVMVPRVAHTTGYLDTHELAIDGNGAPLFVATRFNCIAALDARFSFRPVWKPPFITAISDGDCCHLNGLAMCNGRIAYATAASGSDRIDSWREHRREGGILIDIETERIITTGLSMPHSPRVHRGQVWLLDSGRGTLISIDLHTGDRGVLCRLPGFARGLSMIGDNHALVTLSKPRDGGFAGLELDEFLAQPGVETWCGIILVDLRSGDIVAWLRLEGAIRELFDVVALPQVRCPMALGPGTTGVADNIRIAL